MENLYGKIGGGETEQVGDVTVEKNVMDEIRALRDRARAKRDSRTEAESEN